MKLIKLTNSITENTIFINEKHLVAFWVEDGQTVFVTSNEDGIGRAKETPSEILDMMCENEINHSDVLGEMWKQERIKEAKESGQL